MLGVPDLEKLAAERVGENLESILQDALTEQPRKVEQWIERWVEKLEDAYRSGFAEEEIVRVCCKHFTYLQESGAFAKFTDAHPELLRKMLGYVAQHGNAAMDYSSLWGSPPSTDMDQYEEQKE